MTYAKKTLAAGLLTAASLGITSISHAVTFAEPGDGGQTLATARATGTNATTALTAITGTFSSASDADLYAFTITTPGAFSASTVNTSSAAQDTALFLFSATGTAIATNDDASGMSFDSALPAGNALYANLAVGTYYLGISESGNEPTNSASQLLFAGYPGGDTTAVRGAATGLNPTTLSTFNSNEFDTTTSGAYQVDLTGSATSAVPEPSTWATVALGSVAAAAAAFRRRSVA